MNDKGVDFSYNIRHEEDMLYMGVCSVPFFPFST